MEVNSRSGEVDPRGRAVIRYKPEETSVTIVAKSTFLGHVYLDWARYPIVEVETRDQPVRSYVVRFMDLRFKYPDQNRNVLQPTVELDSDLRKIDEWWGEKPPIDPR
jgi:inner membrane protein